MFEEVSVMGDDETRTIEVLEHILDDIFGVEIQVIGWFIHDDDVRFREKHLGECYLGSLSSGEGLNLLFYFVSSYEKPSEHRSDITFFFIIFPEFGDDTLFSIEIREYLRI